MNGLVYHFVSGQSFFSGGWLVIAAVVMAQSQRRVLQRFAGLAFLLGTLAIAISSTPLAYWAYGVLGLAVIWWMISLFNNSKRRTASYGLIAVMLAAMAWEATYHFMPSPPQPLSAPPALTIIGDSVTAGIGENEAETWPQILARTHDVDVQDLSHIGETAASALNRIRGVELAAPLVVIEIGGNDILGSTTTSQFAADLEALLAHLSQAPRQLVMFELPLPPFYHEYGRIQRELATRYNVFLVPKRFFLDVLAGDASTLDTVHLSQAGHQQMAETVWKIIEPMHRR